MVKRIGKWRGNNIRIKYNLIGETQRNNDRQEERKLDNQTDRQIYRVIYR